jgi:hypothetical protein
VNRLPSRDWIAGAVLVIVGLFFLAGRLVPGLDRFIPLIVGLGLVGVFLATRWRGALVPGGVLCGVGVGTVIATQPDSTYGGGAFLISLGGGFLLVSLLAALYQVREARAWPLVPGSVLVTMGVLILAGNQGRAVLEFAQTWWPVVLVAIGAWVLVGAQRARMRGGSTGAEDGPAAGRAVDVGSAGRSSLPLSGGQDETDHG